jgi:aldose 1-epimerase
MAAPVHHVAADPAELRSPSGWLEATFLPRIGMLGWSLRDQGVELLGRPVSLDRYVETREPTAIALLHPWANRLASPEYEIAGRRVTLDMHAPNVLKDPYGLPIHGLAAASPHWELLEAAPGRIRAGLDYAAWPELERGFPFPHRLELTARSEPVRIPPAPLGERSFDDAFDALDFPPEFSLAGGGRRLHVLFLEGYRFAQVYAPPGSDFISFEPMTAPVNPFESDRTLLVQPGSSYRARFEIGVTVG